MRVYAFVTENRIHEVLDLDYVFQRGSGEGQPSDWNFQVVVPAIGGTRSPQDKEFQLAQPARRIEAFARSADSRVDAKNCKLLEGTWSAGCFGSRGSHRPHLVPASAILSLTSELNHGTSAARDGDWECAELENHAVSKTSAIPAQCDSIVVACSAKRKSARCRHCCGRFVRIRTAAAGSGGTSSCHVWIAAHASWLAPLSFMLAVCTGAATLLARVAVASPSITEQTTALHDQDAAEASPPSADDPVADPSGVHEVYGWAVYEYDPYEKICESMEPVGHPRLDDIRPRQIHFRDKYDVFFFNDCHDRRVATLPPKESDTVLSVDRSFDRPTRTETEADKEIWWISNRRQLLGVGSEIDVAGVARGGAHRIYAVPAPRGTKIADPDDVDPKAFGTASLAYVKGYFPGPWGMMTFPYGPYCFVLEDTPRCSVFVDWDTDEADVASLLVTSTGEVIATGRSGKGAFSFSLNAGDSVRLDLRDRTGRLLDRRTLPERAPEWSIRMVGARCEDGPRPRRCQVFMKYNIDKGTYPDIWRTTLQPTPSVERFDVGMPKPPPAREGQIIRMEVGVTGTAGDRHVHTHTEAFEVRDTFVKSSAREVIAAVENLCVELDANSLGCQAGDGDLQPTFASLAEYIPLAEYASHVADLLPYDCRKPASPNAWETKRATSQSIDGRIFTWRRYESTAGTRCLALVPPSDIASGRIDRALTLVEATVLEIRSRYDSHALQLERK